MNVTYHLVNCIEETAEISLKKERLGLGKREEMRIASQGEKR